MAEQESAPSTVQSFAHCFGDVVETDPIKGNFSNVARCRLSGTLLGPTNHQAERQRASAHAPANLGKANTPLAAAQRVRPEPQGAGASRAPTTKLRADSGTTGSASLSAGSGLCARSTDSSAPGHPWKYGADCCDICGEGLFDKESDSAAEVTDTQTGERLIVHAEPCAFEHGDRYVVA